MFKGAFKALLRRCVNLAPQPVWDECDNRALLKSLAQGISVNSHYFSNTAY